MKATVKDLILHSIATETHFSVCEEHKPPSWTKHSAKDHPKNHSKRQKPLLNYSIATPCQAIACKRQLQAMGGARRCACSIFQRDRQLLFQSKPSKRSIAKKFTEQGFQTRHDTSQSARADVSISAVYVIQWRSSVTDKQPPKSP